MKVNRQTGMCLLCTERCHLEQERAFNGQLERERAHAEEPAKPEEVRRERDMMRQRNSRLCGKYGLKGRRERRKWAAYEIMQGIAASVCDTYSCMQLPQPGGPLGQPEAREDATGA